MKFVESELALTVGEDHARTRSFSNVAQLVFRVYVVIARVQAAVVFQRNTLSAELVVHAHLRVFAHPDGDGILKLVDEDLADVTAVPLIPDLAEEVPPVIGINGPVRDDRIRMSWMRSGGMGSGVVSQCCGAILLNCFGSTQGMNCISREATSFFRKR